MQPVVACAPGRRLDEFAALQAADPRPLFVEGRTPEVLAAADVVITASGTATAETALHERPMVVIYKLSPLTYALGKPLDIAVTATLLSRFTEQSREARAAICCFVAPQAKLTWQFISDPQWFTLAMALYGMQGQYSSNTPWSEFAAMSVIVSIPIVLVFFGLQRYMVGGLTSGGVKG